MKTLHLLIVLVLFICGTLCQRISVEKKLEIEVGKNPNGLTISGKNLYVALRGEESIGVFDISSAVPANISKWDAPGEPFDVLVDTNGQRLSVTQNSMSSLSFYIIQNGRLGDSLSVPKGPGYFAREIQSQTGHFIASEADILISFDFGTQEILRSYRTGLRPYFVSISRLGRVGYVTNNGEDSVSVINLVNGLSQVIKLPNGSKPTGCALTPSGELLVTSSGLGSLLFINTTSLNIERSLAVGNSPTFVDISEDGNFAFVANSASSTVSVVNVNLRIIVDTIPVGDTPTVVRSFGNNLYVSNERSGTVTFMEYFTL